MMERTQDRVGCGSTESAERGFLQELAQPLELHHVFGNALAGGDALEYLEHPLAAFPAGRAFTAGFILAERQEKPGDRHHAVALVHDDHST